MEKHFATILGYIEKLCLFELTFHFFCLLFVILYNLVYVKILHYTFELLLIAFNSSERRSYLNFSNPISIISGNYSGTGMTCYSKMRKKNVTCKFLLVLILCIHSTIVKELSILTFSFYHLLFFAWFNYRLILVLVHLFLVTHIGIKACLAVVVIVPVHS